MPTLLSSPPFLSPWLKAAAAEPVLISSSATATRSVSFPSHIRPVSKAARSFSVRRGACGFISRQGEGIIEEQWERSARRITSERSPTMLGGGEEDEEEEEDDDDDDDDGNKDEDKGEDLKSTA